MTVPGRDTGNDLVQIHVRLNSVEGGDQMPTSV